MAMTGILGTKLGMTQVFDETGQVVPVTVVQAGPCVVTAVRTPDNDGYSAVQIGFGEINPRKVTKPVAGLFEKAGVTPRRYVAEIRTEGFAGVMKRHHFKGLSASHGTQRKHRSPGSIGACATPSRVFKGVRMAGRMGAERTTVQSLTVHAVDSDKNLLLIKGAVPGPRGGLVVVRSAAREGN
jgi:large subunit ribosomal protein L3